MLATKPFLDLNAFQHSLYYEKILYSILELIDLSDGYRKYIEQNQPYTEGVVLNLGTCDNVNYRFFLSFSSMKSHSLDSLTDSFRTYMNIAPIEYNLDRDSWISTAYASMYYGTKSDCIKFPNKDRVPFMDEEEIRQIRAGEDSLYFQKSLVCESEMEIMQHGFLSLLRSSGCTKQVNLRTTVLPNEGHYKFILSRLEIKKKEIRGYNGKMGE